MSGEQQQPENGHSGADDGSNKAEAVNSDAGKNSPGEAGAQQPQGKQQQQQDRRQRQHKKPNHRHSPNHGSSSSGGPRRKFSAATDAPEGSGGGGGGGGRQQSPIVCPGHSRPVRDVYFSPVTQDGIFLISGCLDGRAMLRDGDTGDWIGSFLGHKGAIWCARLDQTATVAATASGDFSVKLWDATSGAQLQEWSHRHIVKSVVFAGEDRMLLSGGRYGVLRRFDLSELREDPTAESEKGTAISRIVVPPGVAAAGKDLVGGFRPSDSVALTAHEEESVVKIWDLRSMAVERTLQLPGEVSDLKLTSDGSVLIASAGRTVAFFDSQNFGLLKKLELDTMTVDSISYHPSSARLVTGSSEDLWAREWDYETGAELRQYRGHHGPVHCVAHHPVIPGAFATSSEDGTIRLWNFQKSEPSGSSGASAPSQKDSETTEAEEPPVEAAEEAKEADA